MGVAVYPHRSGPERHWRAVPREPRRQRHRRSQTPGAGTDRPGPAADRGAMAEDVRRRPRLQGRPGDDERDERHRHGAVGSGRQGGGPASACHARRRMPRPREDVSRHRRRPAALVEPGLPYRAGQPPASSHAADAPEAWAEYAHTLVHEWGFRALKAHFGPGEGVGRPLRGSITSPAYLPRSNAAPAPASMSPSTSTTRTRASPCS